MNEERTHVLQMLANGKISVDEAQALLGALEKGGKPNEASVESEPVPRRHSHRASRRWRRKRRRHREPEDLIDQVLELRIHGIDGRFIAEMKESGLGDLTRDDLVALKIHGISPAYIDGLRQAGLEDISVDDLVEMAIHGVDPDFVDEMRAVTSRDLSVDQLVALRIHGVNADLFKEIMNLGLIDDESTPEAKGAAVTS